MTPTENPTAHLTETAAAILSELTTELQPWAAVRQRISGTETETAAALVDLFERHEVTAVKIAGATFVRLASDWDRLAAAAERDRALQIRHRLPVSRCRPVVTV